MSTTPQIKYNVNNTDEIERNIQNGLTNMVDIYYSLNPNSTTDQLLQHLNSKLANIKIPKNFPVEAFFCMKLDKHLKPKYVFIDEGKIVEVEKSEIFKQVENHVENNSDDFFFSETSYFEIRYRLMFDFVDEDEPFTFKIIHKYYRIFLCSNPKTFMVEQDQSYYSEGTHIQDNVNSLVQG